MWFYDIREVYQSRAGTFRKYSNVLFFLFETHSHICSILYKLITESDAAAKSAQLAREFGSEHFSVTLAFL